MVISDCRRRAKDMDESNALIFLLVFYLVLLGNSAGRDENRNVYQLTFETCGIRRSGTHEEVIVLLFNKTGINTTTTISGKGKIFNTNRTDVFNLTSFGLDLGPICKVKLYLKGSSESDFWRMSRLTIRHILTNDEGTFGTNDCKTKIVAKKQTVYERNEPTDPWKVWGDCDCENRTRRRLPDPCRDHVSDDEKPCTPNPSVCAGHVMVFVAVGSVLGLLALLLIVLGVVFCIKHSRHIAPTVNIELPPRQVNTPDALLRSTITLATFRENHEFRTEGCVVPYDGPKTTNLYWPLLPAPYREFDSEYIYA